MNKNPWQFRINYCEYSFWDLTKVIHTQKNPNKQKTKKTKNF